MVFNTLVSQGPTILSQFYDFAFKSFLLTCIFTSSKEIILCNGLKKVIFTGFETSAIAGFMSTPEEMFMLKIAETMQVVQWILVWEYVKKNCSLKLTNMMSCVNKTGETRTTNRGEGICLSPLCQDTVNQN